ncbi:MAG: hypothetical protein JNK84_20700 [Phreatobacter sp.]|uniref:hypothetical protein n=1 Tax=Phreatobacter sp. TaxID=1966341 RepID=UPI001A5CEB1D|nr:hypothetical protein [Phreatobacter sp.]MBL8571503.1 hypothetical protein [Phreatobacter sp.]
MSAHTHASGQDHRGHLHDHGHPHDHGHLHDHGHPHGHDRPAPARMASAMLMSAPARLGVAAGLAVLLWGLVAWAIA